MTQGLSYDDILIRPTYSTIESRSECDISTYLTENIRLNTPIIAANMDTVCEKEMAVKMALLGGVGIIHRYMSVSQQAEQIKAVKRHTTSFRTDFYFLPLETTVSFYKKRSSETGVKTFPVVFPNPFIADQPKYRLAGLITRRDTWGVSEPNQLIKETMTPFKSLITIDEEDFTETKALQLMLEHKVEQLPVIKKGTDYLVGLVSRKDLNHFKLKYPLKSLDKSRQGLLVGAAVGVKLNPEALQPLMEQKPDFLCIDIAHGHHSLTDTTLASLKAAYPETPVIVGNVATLEAVDHYQDKADGIKVGIGPGCFAAGTRVLMANGYYKNIEDIQKDEFVINGNGEAVKVLDAFTTGLRRVSRIRNSIWHQDTYATPDHNYLVGSGEWVEIGSTQNRTLLLPHQINFKLKDSFENTSLEPSYSLGIIVGFSKSKGIIEGDTLIFNFKNENASSIGRLDSAFKDIFGSITATQVGDTFKYVCPELISFLESAKDTLFISHKDYLRGIYLGLKHLSYLNDLANEFLLTARMLYLNSWFDMGSYALSLNKPKYTNIRLKSYTPLEDVVPVYDISVDCPTHSFIANGAIVHNSACRTRVVTGCGVPQLTAVMECASKGYPYIIADGGITNSGDIVKAIFGGAATVMIGGLLAGTSDSPGRVMEMDGRKVKKFRGMASHEAYLEMNESLGQDIDAFHFEAEGASGYVDYKGETSDFINRLVQGLKSGMSYCGSKTIFDLKDYGRNPNNFYTLSPMAFSRNGSHNMKAK